MTHQNQVLKGIISEIASKTSSGRMTLDWGIIYERGGVKKPAEDASAEDPKPEDTEINPEAVPDADAEGALAGTDASEDGAPEGDATDADAGVGDDPMAGLDDASTKAEPDGENASEEEVSKDKEDIAKLNAEKAKASAEKEKAEQELEDESFIKLGSPSGVGFLLGKAVETAFNNNTIDTLANEFVQKLKITTQDDFNVFSEEMVQYNTVPGVANLLASMSNVISKKQ